MPFLQKGVRLVAIKDRNLAIGQVLVASYKGEQRKVTIESRDKDKLGFRLDGGEVYSSLSQAGGAITGGSVNGWAFFTPEGEVRYPAARAAKEPRNAGRIGKQQIEVHPPLYDEAKSQEARASTANRECALGAHLLRGPSPDFEYHQKRGEANGRIIDICCACAHPETLKPPPGAGRKPSTVTVRKTSSIGSSDPDDDSSSLPSNPAISAKVSGLNKLLAGTAPTKRRSVRRAVK